MKYFFNKYWNVTKHKVFEVEGYLSKPFWRLYSYLSIDGECVGFDVDLCNIFAIWFKAIRKQDHAGVKLRFAIFSYQLSLSLYDNRHWDYDNDCWEENS